MDMYVQHLDAHALSAYKLVHPHVVGLVVAGRLGGIPSPLQSLSHAFSTALAHKPCQKFGQNIFVFLLLMGKFSSREAFLS
jgi:hypothetical protein